MKIEGTVGIQTPADGTIAPARLDRFGAQAVSELSARYYEQAFRGNTMVGANQAAQAVSVALATTYTGLCLSNPIGNQKNLVLKTVAYALTVAPAAIASLHLIGGYSGSVDTVHTTPITGVGLRSTLLGIGTAPTAKLDSAATVANPGYILPLEHGFTAASLPNHSLQPVDIGGLLVIPPGGWVAVGALTAVTGFGAFVWDEVPV